MINSIRRKIVEFNKSTGNSPTVINLSIEDFIKLLEEFKSLSVYDDNDEKIDKLLLECNEEKLRKAAEDMTLYGLQIRIINKVE